MKVLIVLARLCYPLNTGAKIRAYYLISALAHKHQVTMIAYYGDHSEEIFFPHFKEIGIRLIPVYKPEINSNISFRNIYSSIVNNIPVTIAKYIWNDMISSLRDLLSENYDVIHCEHLHVSPMVKDTLLPMVLDAHNVEAQISERYASVEKNWLKKLLLQWNYRKLLRYESEIVKRADLVLAVSEEDRQIFRSFGAGDNVRVLENGVDIDYFKPKETENVNGIVFVGSMDWKPNIEGINFFLDEILPVIRLYRPDVMVTIVGKDPPKSLVIRCKSENGVEITGTVADVRPYVEKAAVCIVPLTIGGGTRLKVLEGFAMGKAVVSTSLGCEGIECINGEHLLVADDAASFARAVVSLLDSREHRKSLGENARRLVEQKYSWNILGKKLLSYYDKLYS